MLCQISTINMLYVIQLGPRLARVGERITRVDLVEVGGGEGRAGNSAGALWGNVPI